METSVTLSFAIEPLKYHPEELSLTPVLSGTPLPNQHCHSSGNTVLSLPVDTGGLSLIGFRMARSIDISWASLPTSIS